MRSRWNHPSASSAFIILRWLGRFEQKLSTKHPLQLTSSAFTARSEQTKAKPKARPFVWARVQATKRRPKEPTEKKRRWRAGLAGLTWFLHKMTRCWSQKAQLAFVVSQKRRSAILQKQFYFKKKKTNTTWTARRKAKYFVIKTTLTLLVTGLKNLRPIFLSSKFPTEGPLVFCLSLGRLYVCSTSTSGSASFGAFFRLPVRLPTALAPAYPPGCPP